MLYVTPRSHIVQFVIRKRLYFGQSRLILLQNNLGV